jgi:glycosyltransferase involved in cell wall biosynthesis
MPSQAVTILVPTFNRAEFLNQAILNMCFQTYADFKILIYNDGSTDNTEQMIFKLISLKGMSIRLTGDMVNRGVGFARNRLLDECDTEIACWWDSDDLCNKYRIQLQMDQMQRGFDLVYAGFRHFANNSTLPWNKMPNIQRCPIAFASLMFRVDKSVRFLEDRRFGGEDVAWSAQMKKKYRISTVSRILYYVRYHPNRIGSIKKRLTGSDRYKSYAQVAAKWL